MDEMKCLREAKNSSCEQIKQSLKAFDTALKKLVFRRWYFYGLFPWISVGATKQTLYHERNFDISDVKDEALRNYLSCFTRRRKELETDK